jgi:CMP-N-acetylneuraminic acid synthetase
LSDSECSAVLGVKVLFRSLRTLFHANEHMELSALDAGGALYSGRQTLKPLLTPNGALYLVAAEELRSSGGFVPARCRGLVMDQVASIDIDDPVDWALAEAVAAEGLSWRGTGSR